MVIMYRSPFVFLPNFECFFLLFCFDSFAHILFMSFISLMSDWPLRILNHSTDWTGFIAIFGIDCEGVKWMSILLIHHYVQ